MSMWHRNHTWISGKDHHFIFNIIMLKIKKNLKKNHIDENKCWRDRFTADFCTASNFV